MTKLRIFLDESGQAVLIRPGAQFATAAVRVLADDADYHAAPAGSIVWHACQHAADAADAWGPEDFDRFQVMEMEEPAPPPGQQVVKLEFEVSSDGEHASVQLVPTFGPSTRTVGAAQFKLELLSRPGAVEGSTLMAAVTDALKAAKQPDLDLYWAEMREFTLGSDRFLKIMDLAGLLDQAASLFTGADALR